MFISESDCFYDTAKGKEYMGRMSGGDKDGSRRTCIDWKDQTEKTDSMFADGSRSAAGPHCRNPDDEQKPWCYYNANGDFVYCSVYHCRTYSITTMTKLHITS